MRSETPKNRDVIPMKDLPLTASSLTQEQDVRSSYGDYCHLSFLKTTEVLPGSIHASVGAYTVASLCGA
jgi:hypothetical protein